MKLTKYQHACLVLEKESSTIIIDPGSFSHDFIMPKRVDAIIITHNHPDHFDPQLVRHILDHHSKATLIAHEEISGQFTDHSVIAPQVGPVYTISAFSLRFFGGQHAQIAETIPVPVNFGVLVDESLYYPGDSFVVPENVSVKALALPVSAPWLKLSEVLAFLSQVKPEIAFPTHDGILSNDGKAIVDRMVGATATGQNTHYIRLDGSSVVIS